MLRVFIFLFFFVCIKPSVAAIAVQQAVKMETVKKMVNEDTLSKVVPRKFDPQKLQAYKSDKDFVYDDSSPEDQSMLSRFWDWVWERINSVLTNETSGTLIGYIVIATLVALIIFAILKFAGMDLKFFATKSKDIEVPYEESLDNIHEIDFNEEIEKAANSGNFRLAIRLSYLKALKYLSDTNQINWQPEKTNQVYVNEILVQDTKATFKVLTQQFEYIWYGEFLLTKAQFDAVKSDFDNFNRTSA